MQQHTQRRVKASLLVRSLRPLRIVDAGAPFLLPLNDNGVRCPPRLLTLCLEQLSLLGCVERHVLALGSVAHDVAKLGEGVAVDEIAKRTPGFSGADLGGAGD